MEEILMTIVEVAVALAIVLVTIFMNNNGKNDHTLTPLRVPVRSVRKNRR
jgi:hypothetical protein